MRLKMRPDHDIVFINNIVDTLSRVAVQPGPRLGQPCRHRRDAGNYRRAPAEQIWQDSFLNEWR